MRRTILYICLALFTFTTGFLTVGRFEQLTVALPVAALIFILLKSVASFGLTPHHLKVALLTLLIWTPLAAITLYTVLPKAEPCVIDMPEEENKAAKDAVTRQITFKFVSPARVMTVDRGCIEMEIYESSDRIEVYASTEDYSSAEEAGAELKRALRTDVKIIDRESLLDSEGRQIGERIIGARFYGDNSSGFIYRVEGNRLSYIGSTSLSRALDFENRFRLNDRF